MQTESERDREIPSSVDGGDSSTTNIINQVKSPPPPPANEAPPPPAAAGGGGISDVIQRWRREDLLKRVSLGLRGIALPFSFIAFVVMASNKHGVGMNFDEYEEFRYVLAVTILSTVYTGGQLLFHVLELSTGKKLLHQPRTTSLIHFSGDQIMAYLLISASSSGASLTNRMGDEIENTFIDYSDYNIPFSAFTKSSAAAIGMSFLAFFCLAVSALISGFKLSNQPYI